MPKSFKPLAPYRYLLLTCVLSYLFFSRFAGGPVQVSAQGGGCPDNPLPRTCSGYAVCTSGGNCGQLAFTSCCAAGPYPTNTPAPTPTTAPTATQTPSPTPTNYPYQLQAAYRFNNSGNLGQSSVGSGIDGTNTSVSYVTSGALDGGSGSFNGTSSYLSVADNAVFNQSAMSVSAWANITAHTSGAPLFNRRTAGDIGGVTLELDSSSNATCKMYINGAWRSASTTASSITTGTWFKLTCTYDGTNLKIYKDSVLANTTAISGTVNNPSSPSIWIGRNIVSSSVYLNGLVDEVCVYGKGLSSTEVTTLANSTCDGLQGAYPPVPTPTGGGSVVATGGTVTDVGGYRIHTFTSSGTFTVTQAGNVESLIVAGGGGGGNVGDRSAGGGGAGGLQYTASTAVTAQAYTVTVGNGGGPVTNGSNSSALGITATGGGYGGAGYGGGVGNGGSGGGCIHNNNPGAGTGIAGQGFRGGNSGYDSGNGSSGTFSACGGGGAGAVGGNASTITGGAGGVGLAYSISGASVYYAGGGGGGVQNLGQGGNVGVGGNGGGGNGGVNGSGVSGTANTGGGGGGVGSTGTAGSGGSGIVIIKYLIPSSTPTPSPTTAPITGCNAVTWSGGTNVTATANTLVGNADSGSTTMSNGAQANFTAAQGTSPGGHAQVPSGTERYRAMWGLSYTGTAASDIDFAWLLPYYDGSNKAYVSIPGNNIIDMGSVTAGDRYGVQVSGSQVVYTKLPSGSTTWQTMYVFSPTITYSLEFRGRVEDYAQVFNAFAGSSCQMVVVSTPTPSPTSSTGGGIAITPWYSQNLSTYPEYANHTYDDPNESGYIYMVGRRSIGYPFGWGQSSAGYVQKIRKSDKVLIWSRETGLTFSPPYLTGGIADVKTDASYVYISGYDAWGTNLYVAKLNKSDGTIVWESSTYQGGSWNTQKGTAMVLDASNIYVVGLPGPSDSDTSWQIMKKNKSDGATTLTRESNINNPGWDLVNALEISGTTLIAAGTTKQGDLTGSFYYETINTATMNTISTVTGTAGFIGTRAIVLDPGGEYFYAAGLVPLSTPSGWMGNPDNTSTSQIRVEKRKISDLSLSWSYTTTQTTDRQYNPGITSDGTNLIVGFVNNIDYSTGYGSSMRLVRLSTSGTKMDDYLYYGPSSINSLSSDGGSTIYATGSTLNRAESAIYRMDGLYNVTPTPGFGLAVSQSTPSTVTQGSPVQWTVDIDNSSLASEAAWAFTFTAAIPTQINGIVWSCSVINTGTAAGEMIGYPTRCSSVAGGTTAYDSGSGTNRFTFGHTSNADPLIQPGGKLRISVSGVIAANTPEGTLNATMSITNYQGWPTNHYYTTNFLVVNGPTPLAGTPAPGLYTLSDSDISNNQSTLAMSLGAPPASTPTPTGPTGVPALTATPTLTPSPTPIPPATVIANCPGTYLRAIVAGQEQYYCKTADNNFVVIRGSTVERLNGSGTRVTDVTFTNVGVVNGEQLIRVDFTIQSTTVRPGTTTPTSKTYSLTVRLR